MKFGTAGYWKVRDAAYSAGYPIYQERFEALLSPEGAPKALELLERMIDPSGRAVVASHPRTEGEREAFAALNDCGITFAPEMIEGEERWTAPIGDDGVQYATALEALRATFKCCEREALASVKNRPEGEGA